MKTFSVAVAVAVVLTFICVQQSSAVPVTELQMFVSVLQCGFYCTQFINRSRSWRSQ
uniref:Uncharacterized protein n=1 Tax=Pundamilia nyererei TaxID=303518 RepID=A0A3B4FE99_9CICH